MKAVTLAALGDFAFAQGLGKKSTESDIQLASFREGDVQVSMVIPFRYPEKLQPLSYSVESADAGLLVVGELTREVGEQILAADAAGLERGLIVLRNYLQPEQLQPLLKGTNLEGWDFLTDESEPAIRAKLAEFAVAPREGAVRIPIDHHFHVKGIGTVILGFVTQGEVKQHDTLRAYPSEETCQVRSIQVHDADVKDAGTGAHVGLALKNVENDRLDRGMVLAPEGTLQSVKAGATLTLDVAVTKFFKAGVKADGVYYVGHGMQFVGVRAKGALAAGASGKVEFELQKPLAFDAGDAVSLYNLDNPAQRVVGSGRIV